MQSTVCPTGSRPAVCSLLFLAALPGLAVAQAGAIDPSFGTNGVVLADLLGPGNPSYFGWSAARNPATGEFVVAAGIRGGENHEQWTIMRFAANGALDLSFGTGGRVRTDFQTFDAHSDHPSAIAFDTSGAPAGHRILVAGYATVPDSLGYAVQQVAVTAYLPDGSLDPSFAGDGVFLLAGSYSAQAIAVRALADGRVVVVGQRDADGVALRLLHDGSLDPTYGDGGIATVVGNGASMVAATVHADGRAMLGRFATIWPTEPPWIVLYESKLTRLDASGAPDAGFGTGGTAAFSGEFVVGLAARPDGTLIGLHAPIEYGNPYRLRLYASDGSVTGADTTLAAGFSPGSLDIAADGAVVLGGSSASNYTLLAAAKTTPSAALDATFDTDGYSLLDLGGAQSNARAMALPDGSVAIAGLRTEPVTGITSFVVGRLDAAGAEDTGFAGGAGFGAIASQGSSPEFGRDIAVHQADGKLVVLARTFGDSAATVLRYLPDGSPDASFGQNGVRRLLEPGVMGVDGSGIALQSNGRIIVTGLRFEWLTAPPWIQYELVAVGLTQQGTLDPTFDGDGIAAIVLPGVQFASGGGIALQPDDKILACTSSYVSFPYQQMTVARWHANGAPDTGFGSGGLAWVGSAGASSTANSLAVAADGRIAVGGTVETPYPSPSATVAVAWLGTTGTLLAGPDTTVPGFGVDVAVDGSGRAVVAAQRYWGTPVYNEFWEVIDVIGESPWSLTDYAAVRVLPSGALDASFGTGGVAVVPVPAATEGYVTTLAIQPDGRIVLAGSSTLNPAPDTYVRDFIVLRLLATGALDASFSGDGAANVDAGSFDVPSSVLLQSDGKIVVVGTSQAWGSGFEEKNDVAVLRLLGVGSPDALVEALLGVVQTMAEQQMLNQGRARALSTMLQAAMNQIDNGNRTAASQQIAAFRNQVLAFHAAAILGTADAMVLLAAADGILALLAIP
ncbi:MAG TPA: hypothetical protein VF384_14505 [Planctomycetota bacterium]